jgi:hypothetical protein
MRPPTAATRPSSAAPTRARARRGRRHVAHLRPRRRRPRWDEGTASLQNRIVDLRQKMEGWFVRYAAWCVRAPPLSCSYPPAPLARSRLARQVRLRALLMLASPYRWDRTAPAGASVPGSKTGDMSALTGSKED